MNFSRNRIFNLKVSWIKPFISGFRPNPIEHQAPTGRPHCLLRPYRRFAIEYRNYEQYTQQLIALLPQTPKLTLEGDRNCYGAIEHLVLGYVLGIQEMFSYQLRSIGSKFVCMNGILYSLTVTTGTGYRGVWPEYQGITRTITRIGGTVQCNIAVKHCYS